MSLRGIENAKFEQKITNQETKKTTSTGKKQELIITTKSFNPNNGLELEYAPTEDNTTKNTVGRGDSENLNTHRKKMEELYIDHQVLANELTELQNQKNEQEMALQEAQRAKLNAGPTGVSPEYKIEKNYIVIDETGNTTIKSQNEINNLTNAIEIEIIKEINEAQGELGQIELKNKINELEKEYKELDNELTTLSVQIETCEDIGDSLDAMVNKYNSLNKKLEIVKINKEKVEAKLEILKNISNNENEDIDTQNPLDTQINLKKEQLETKQEEIEKQRDEIVKSISEARKKAKAERKELIEKSKQIYEEAKEKANNKYASNTNALNNGQYSTAEYYDKNVDDAAKLYKPYYDAKRNKEIANNALKTQYPELNVKGKEPLDLAKENVETIKSMVKEKQSEFIKAQRELDSDNHNATLQEKQQEAKLAWETAKGQLADAQKKYDEIIAFAHENRTIKLWDGDKQFEKSTNYYTIATANIESMEKTWHSAKEKGLATLDCTKEKEYNTAENKYKADIRKDKNYIRELKEEIKDVKSNVKSSANLVDIKYANHICRTQEEAEKYGKDFINTFASNLANKIIITSEQTSEGTYMPIYMTQNGNKLSPEALRNEIVNNGKNL